MRIGIQTWGTEGDIRPFINLAVGLKKSGHAVSLVVADVYNKNYDSYISDQGIDQRQVEINVSKHQIKQFEKSMARTRIWDLEEKSILKLFYEPFKNTLYDEAARLCETCDIIIRHFADYSAQVAAEKYKVPVVSIHIAHRSIPSKFIQPKLQRVSFPKLNTFLNTLVWSMVKKLFDIHLLAPVNQLRTDKGLKRHRDFLTNAWGSNNLNLISVSESICRVQTDWKPHQKVCGFLASLERKKDSHIPDALRDFVEQDQTVIFITLGSMVSPEKASLIQGLIQLFVESAKNARCRAIIQAPKINDTGFPKSEHVYYIDYIPYADIFPFCSAIVHHGGAGTVHHACRAGVPSVVIPVLQEQCFWASELQSLGVSKGKIRFRELSEKKLTSLIKSTIGCKTLKSSAKALAIKMKQENNGVQTAINILENQFSSLKP